MQCDGTKTAFRVRRSQQTQCQLAAGAQVLYGAGGSNPTPSIAAQPQSRTVRVGPDGWLYVLTDDSDGKVLRLTVK